VITFDNLNNGELAEKFRMALAQIGHNIMDPNMDPAAVREMSIKISFKPTGGGALTTSCKVNTKLAGFDKSTTTLLIGQDIRSGRIEIREHGSRDAPMQINTGGYTVQTEVVRPNMEPDQGFDTETGEIYEPARGPIDLRSARARQ